jgi:hypothetical protein
MEATIASERMDGIIKGGNTVNSNSELSTVLSNRFLGLDEDWWKEKVPATEMRAGSVEASTATVTVVRTQSKSKWVY